MALSERRTVVDPTMPAGVTSDQINLYAYVANNPLKYVDPMGREKLALAIREITRLFNQVGDYFTGIRDSYEFIGLNPELYVFPNSEYVGELLFWESNFKGNQHLVSLASWTIESGDKIICPAALDLDRQCGGYFTINNKKVTLADIGNIWVGYFWSKIGFSYAYTEEQAYVATRDLKFNWNDAAALANEIPDRQYYHIGYDFAVENGDWKLTETDILRLITSSP